MPYDASKPIPNEDVPSLVRATAQGCGFHLAGITPVLDDAENGDPNRARIAPELAYFPQWIAEGRAGEMEYLKRRDADGRLLRSSITVPFPWVRSVIVCAVNYNNDGPYSIDLPEAATEAPDQPAPGWIARYAWSGERQDADTSPPQFQPTDYHAVIREKLERLQTELQTQLGDFEARCFVDTGPLVERVYAKYAGLGWQGKNTCLIEESLGSWFFLGVILTSLELPREHWTQPVPDRCGSCTRCIDACPTDALQPYRMDASQCIAYLTIEKRTAIPAELATKIGRNVFGCDICQEVCPWNNRGDNRGGGRVPITDWPELQARTELVNPALAWLAELDEDSYQRLFRRSPVSRTKYAGLARNVEIAIQNARAK